MSLFKSREFWSTNCDDENEEFDHSSLKISKLNSDHDFILTGSHAGVLRIYKPSTGTEEGRVLSSYKAGDLCVEKTLNFPILQLEVGKLVSASAQVQIAVLHPRNFAIYSFTSKEGNTEHGNQNMLNILYEHKLRRTAANFTIGPFGGTQNRDFIAVQSLDGMLSFFEQETFVFCCFLPNFLLAGPFLYCKRTDSFIVSGSNWSIESYSYKTLSSIGQNTDENDITGLKFGSDWSFNLSEGVLDLQYLYDGFSRESFIMILGERNLYCLTDSGKLKFMKRFDYSPCCFTCYYLGESKLMSVVVSETSTLLVYQNTTLRWSAQLPSLPCALARGNFKNLRGILVCLTEEGTLSCSYLGTEPSLFSAPPLVNQELDYEQAESELLALNKIIRSTYNNDIKLTNQSAERELILSVNVNPHLERCTYRTDFQEMDPINMCEVEIELIPHALFEEINVVAEVQKPLTVTPQAEFYQSLRDKTSFKCRVYLENDAEVASLEMQVIVSCISSIGLPRVISKTVTLPMNLVLKTHPPVKESLLKVTLNINKNSIALGTLFPEFVGENALTQNSNAVCFTNISGSGMPVTILLAKSSQRYRLQSDSVASINVCVQEMVRRLNKHFSTTENFQLTTNSQLPITHTIQYLNEHFEYRRKVVFLQNELIQLGAQFRIIQKRLITKFKDKNPTPLTNLDMLLMDTYNQTLETSRLLENANDDLLKSQIHLSCALSLCLTLIKLMEDVKLASILENALSPYIYDCDGQNFEDVLDVSLSYLLRTALAKSDKDKLRAPHTNYEEVKDLTKLEKHLTMVLERSSKKGAILEAQTSQENEDVVNQNVPDEEVIENMLPIGSKLGESSTRILSARTGLLGRRQRVQTEP